jgi:threonyl-tRNA synthetase
MRKIESGKLSVTIRAESTPKSPAKSKMTVEYLRRRIYDETKGKPWRRLPLPMNLSERPKFI